MFRNLILIVGVYYGLQAGYEATHHLRADPELQTALEIQCGEASGQERAECVADWTQEFELGASEPAAIVRQHCTRWQSEWSVTHESANPGADAPALCKQRYGGWIRG